MRRKGVRDDFTVLSVMERGVSVAHEGFIAYDSMGDGEINTGSGWNPCER